MRDALYVLVLLAAVALIASPVAYQFKSAGAWRDSRTGWHLMTYMGAFAAVMVLTVVSLLLRLSGHGPLPEWLGIPAWGLIAFVGWWRLLLILHAKSAHEE